MNKIVFLNEISVVFEKHIKETLIKLKVFMNLLILYLELNLSILKENVKVEDKLGLLQCMMYAI